MRLAYSNLQLSVLAEIREKRHLSVDDALMYNQLTFGSLWRHKFLDYNAFTDKIHITKEGRYVLDTYFSMVPMNKRKAKHVSRFAKLTGRAKAQRKAAA